MFGLNFKNFRTSLNTLYTSQTRIRERASASMTTTPALTIGDRERLATYTRWHTRGIHATRHREHARFRNARRMPRVQQLRVARHPDSNGRKLRESESDKPGSSSHVTRAHIHIYTHIHGIETCTWEIKRKMREFPNSIEREGKKAGIR